MTSDLPRELRLLRVDPALCVPADLAPAAEWLAAGGLVIFPTDTLYGLAVDPRSELAVSRLFALKGRDSASALPLIAASATQVRSWGMLNAATAKLAAAFWPGPLSLICSSPADIVEGVHAGTATVAVRVPAHRVAAALAEAFGGAITATSANRSGEPPVDTVADLGPIAHDPHVMIIDAGRTPGGRPSTIVDARGDAPVLVRAGAIAWDRVLESL